MISLSPSRRWLRGLSRVRQLLPTVSWPLLLQLLLLLFGGSLHTFVGPLPCRSILENLCEVLSFPGISFGVRHGSEEAA